MKIHTFAKLGDICDVSAGQGAPQGDSNYCDNGTPFVKAGNLNELIQGKKETEIQKVSEDVAKKHKLKKYPAGSLLFAKSGMSCMKGYVYQLKNDSYVVSHLAIVKPKKDSSDYIEYCLRHIKPNSLVKDEAYPSISLQDISNLEIPLPSLEVQVKIADQLSKCTQIINKHKEQLEKYDFLIKSRFIEMFGEIDISPQRNDWTELKDITTIYTGTTPSTTDEENWNGDILWITPAEMTSESFYIYDTERKITEKGQKSKSLSLMPVNTVLLSTRAPIGKVGIVGSPMTCNQGFKNFYCKEDILNPVYLYFLFKSNTEYLNSKGTGTTFKELSKSAAEKIKVPIPDFELQNQFAAFVQQIDKSKFAVQKSLEKAEILYKSLMQEYFA